MFSVTNKLEGVFELPNERRKNKHLIFLAFQPKRRSIIIFSLSFDFNFYITMTNHINEFIQVCLIKK